MRKVDSRPRGRPRSLLLGGWPPWQVLELDAIAALIPSSPPQNRCAPQLIGDLSKVILRKKRCPELTISGDTIQENVVVFHGAARAIDVVFQFGHYDRVAFWGFKCSGEGCAISAFLFGKADEVVEVGFVAFGHGEYHARYAGGVQ